MECMDMSVTGRLQTDFSWAAYDLVVNGLGFISEDEKYETKWVKYLVDEPNLLRSLGVYPLLFLIILLFMLYSSILAFGKNNNLSVRRQYLNLRRKLYWNSFLRFYLQIDLKLTHQAIAVAWFLGMTDFLRFSLNSALSLVLIAAPFCILWVLVSNKDSLMDRETKAKYSTMYDGIKTESNVTVSYTFVFLARRLAFVLTVILLQKYDFFKVMIFLWLEGFYVIYVGWYKPHVESVYNMTEKINESVLLLVGYIMFLNTDYLGNQLIRYYLGWCIIFLGLTLYLVNFIVMFGIFMVELHHAYRMYTIRRKFILAYGRKEMIEENFFKSSRDSGPNGNRS